MSFKLSLFLVLFFLAACGLKGNPVASKDSHLPSLVEENYPDIELAQPLKITN